MSLESFSGFDSGEGMSEGALEELQQKMKAAAAQIAAIKKEEGKQKKTEDELFKVLLKFINRSDKKELCLLISRALEQNIPANFILAIIILGNEDVQKEIDGYMMLSASAGTSRSAGTPHGNTTSPADASRSAKNSPHGNTSSHEDTSTPADASRSAKNSPHGNTPSSGNTSPPEDTSPPADAKKLIFFDEEDKTLPLKVKVEVDGWIKSMLFQAQQKPQKLLKHSYEVKEEGVIKPILPRLTAFILRDFLEQKKIDENYKKLHDFSIFIIKGILTKIRKGVEKRKFLK